MQVKKINQSLLDVPGWAPFLSRSGVIIAAMLLGSALITAIAANWLTWPKGLRVILIQITITALVVFAWQRSQRKPKEWASVYSLSSLSLALAAVAIGGLLALIGQSYQTGADPWWLFALWAALLLPWLITLRSPFIILLVVVLTNTTLYLLPFNPVISTVLAVLMNGMAVVLVHFFRTEHQPWVEPLALVLSVVLAWYALPMSSSQSGGVFILLAALVFYYSRRRKNLLLTALCYLALFGQGIYLLYAGLGIGLFSWFITPLILFVSALLIFKDVRQLWRSYGLEPNPWVMRLLYLPVQLLVVFFFAITFFSQFGAVGEMGMYVLLIAAFAGVLYLQGRKSPLLSQDLPVLVWLSSMALSSSLLFYERPELWLGLLGIALNAALYYRSAQSLTMRFTNAALMVVLGVWLWEVYIGIGQQSGLQLLLFGAVLGLAGLCKGRPALKPLWWSVALALAVFVLMEPPQWLLAVALPPAALLALLGWLWAYAQRDALLFWASVLLLSGSLGWHYYDLDWSLLHKALALGVSGAALLFLSFLLHYFTVKPTVKANPTSVGLFLGLVATLVLSSQDVIRKEYLLANGVPVALALAPVDPRSLMQGDYMALSFELSQTVAEVMGTQTETVMAYMHSGEQCASKVVALQNPKNGAIHWLKETEQTTPNLEELAVVRMQWSEKQGRWLPNGVDAWFFPEGQAETFSQAQCGVFKTNAAGQALLYELVVPQK